ncbi:MAG: hypothetical protein V7K32_10890 [Nostoc sp.]|uniref:hypothetical protein n=1 Tax=Nostoc sp. TaxID=1180 RepID=UPI002FF51022
MTSFESNEINAVELNGIRMEIMLPNFVALAIPENKPDANAPVRFGISVANNTSKPLVFTQNNYLVPELVGLDGQTLERKNPVDETLASEVYDCTLVMPEKKIVFGIEAKLFWQNNKLQFSNGSRLNYSWFFDAIKPGTYQLRFIYDSPGQPIRCYDKEIGEVRTVETIEKVSKATNFVNLYLVNHIPTPSNAIEVDGLLFETLLTERVIIVPKKKLKSKNSSVKFGIRVTNLSPTPHRFIFFGLTPELQDANGQLIHKSGGRNATKYPQEVDYMLAMPGESVTYFLEGKFEERKKLQGNEPSGGVWCFDNLKPGKYRVRFTYRNENTVAIIDKGSNEDMKLLEGIWKGMVSTPFVDFRITQ